MNLKNKDLSIHDVLQVICNKNLKRPRNFGGISTVMILAKNRAIA
jgi:hypothetical protein